VSVQSNCVCVWERTAEYGDVIVAQCAQHAAEMRTQRARRASRSADTALAESRRKRRR